MAKTILQKRLIEEYKSKISTCNDPTWKKVLILDMQEISSENFDNQVHNWQHAVEVLGSEEAAIKYFADGENNEQTKNSSRT